MQVIIFDCQGKKRKQTDYDENRAEGNICQNKNRLIYKAADYKKIIYRPFIKFMVYGKNDKICRKSQQKRDT